MGRTNTILFTNAKIVIIRKTAKFRAYSKIGIPQKIPTCKYYTHFIFSQAQGNSTNHSE